MEYIIQGGQLLLSLSILIVLHEFGHYLPARWFNTRVEKFYLFFDYKFSIFKKKIKDTEWGIGWIPLGGYVKISGMIDESMDKDQMAKPPEAWEFRSKPAWQRLIIMIGGIVVNLIVGVLIYIMIMFVWGEQIITPESASNGYEVHEYFETFGFETGDKIITINGETPRDVSKISTEIAFNDARVFEVEHLNGTRESITLPEDIDMTMFKADAMRSFVPRAKPLLESKYAGEDESLGFLTGDIVLSVDGQSIAYWDELTEIVSDKKDENFMATVLRDGQEVVLDIALDTLGKIGYELGYDRSEMISTVKYGFFESIPKGVQLGWTTLSFYVKQFKYVFTSKGATSIGGFGAIGSLFDKEWNWHSFWSNTALISIILAFMNFLPIPALDGGHIMFLSYEMISGRKPNEKFMEYAMYAGMIFLLALLLYANGNDVYKAIQNWF